MPKDYDSKGKVVSKKESPYSCLVSTLGSENKSYNYWNDSFWVKIPKIKEYEGEEVLKVFVYTDDNSGSKSGTFHGTSNVVRVAQCNIPDSKLLKKKLDKIFKRFGKNTWIESNSIKEKGDWECSSWYVVYICKYNSSTNTYYDCKSSEPICAEWVYVEEDPVGGGGGGGGPSEDPGECDPMGTEPCFDDGGGSSQPPPPPCESQDPPVWCTNPCDTGDEILDDTGIQEAFELLWEASNTNLPIAQRVEQGGYIRLINGKYKFQALTNMTHSACGIDGSMLPPSNTVAYVHTHPFFQGENTTSVCTGGVTSHQSTHSWDDVITLSQIANFTGNTLVKGYVLDGNNILTFGTTTSPGTGSLDARCGY